MREDSRTLRWELLARNAVWIRVSMPIRKNQVLNGARMHEGAEEQSVE